MNRRRIKKRLTVIAVYGVMYLVVLPIHYVVMVPYYRIRDAWRWRSSDRIAVENAMNLLLSKGYIIIPPSKSE